MFFELAHKRVPESGYLVQAGWPRGAEKGATCAHCVRSGRQDEFLVPELVRSAGVLLHVTSLPGWGGIGDLGQAAYEFIDRLAAAGWKYWQVLPLHPTEPRFDNSPYHSTSAFAGNPLFISPELLSEYYLEGWDKSENPQFQDRAPFTSKKPSLKNEKLCKKPSKSFSKNGALMISWSSARDSPVGWKITHFFQL